MQLTIAFSPCPNDTFIFDALIHQKIDTEGLEFQAVLEDVQMLNVHAKEAIYDISKISYGVYADLMKDYVMMQSGGALGKGVGPLLITHSDTHTSNPVDELVAIPGEDTTAHFLFSMAFPDAKNKIFLRYDEIEQFVLDGRGLGVIIHENRFTYKEKGLMLLKDLGSYWEMETGLPIPLGGIVIRRNYDLQLQQKVNRLIRRSIEYAIEQYPELNDFIRCHAQEMSEEVMRSHIDLYVNSYSLDLGIEGRKAVEQMMNFFSVSEERPIFVS